MNSPTGNSGHNIQNNVAGHVQGPVVQAGYIHGGVHVSQPVYVHQQPVYIRQPVIQVPLTPQLLVLRWLGIAGFGWVMCGEYAAMMVCGFIAVINGKALAPTSTWPKICVGLAFMGAFYGLITALITRRRLLRGRRYRKTILTLVGMVTFPFAFAWPNNIDANTLGTIGVIGAFAGVVMHIVMRLRERRSR